MISTTNIASSRPQVAIGASAREIESATDTAAEKAVENIKRWVTKNPAGAVAAAAVLGLMVGYLVKRR